MTNWKNSPSLRGQIFYFLIFHWIFFCTLLMAKISNDIIMKVWCVTISYITRTNRGLLDIYLICLSCQGGQSRERVKLCCTVSVTSRSCSKAPAVNPDCSNHLVNIMRATVCLCDQSLCNGLFALANYSTSLNSRIFSSTGTKYCSQIVKFLDIILHF